MLLENNGLDFVRFTGSGVDRVHPQDIHAIHMNQHLLVNTLCIVKPPHNQNPKRQSHDSASTASRPQP
ncbi:MAG: hypothetical protein AAGJ35_04670 [Myxococcota bacterium]